VEQVEKIPAILTATGSDTVSAWQGRFHGSRSYDAEGRETWLVTDAFTGERALVDDIKNVAHEVAVVLNREETARRWHIQIVRWSAPEREYEDQEYLVSLHDEEGNQFTLAVIQASEPPEFIDKLHDCLMRCDLDPGLPERRR
jgi:hypothetical protein